MKKKKIFSALVVASIVTTLLAGCAASKSEAADSTATTTKSASSTTQTDSSGAASGTAVAASSADATKVRVAVANDFSPFAYLDEKGNYTGYEVDVLREVDNLLPQYEFDYQTVSDQFVALTSNKVDLITHQWESNPKRQETYLFAKQLITNWTSYIVVKDGRTDIQTVDDLQGKTVMTSQGSNDAYFLETYNKSHNNAIKIVYSSGDTSVTINQLENGTIDAFDSPASVISSYEKNYNVKLGTSNQPLYNSGTFFIYRKDDAKETTLQEAVDGALKTLTDNGTLSQLSVKYLGEDYTKEVNLDGTTSDTSTDSATSTESSK